jgi:NO-binding membrane sensor protein with MHYT domain/CheY-like chemotaxis protein
MLLSGHTLVTFYDHRLVALSVFIAVLSSYAALDLAGRVTFAHGGIRLLWLSGGASAMGIGIWSMHYIGMLALRLPVSVEYDWPTVLLSLLAAVLASAGALFAVSRAQMGPIRAAAGSLFVGSGIAAMHYIGMAAMRLPAMCHYSFGLVALSVVVAVVISSVALHLAFHFRGENNGGGWKKALTALVMGGAIPVMHYTGMAAASFTSLPSENGDLAHAVGISSLGLAGILVVTFMVLGLVLITSLVDRRFSVQAVQLESSEQRYRMIVETAFDAFVGIDSLGKVVDWNAQAQNGFGFIEKVRERSEFAATTILILTSAGLKGDGSRCQKLGVARYLLKPVRKSELLVALGQAVGGGQQIDQQPLITRHTLRGAAEPSVSSQVLLAEDNVTNQKLAGRLLEKRGHRVVFAGNGHEALKEFEDGAFDLIFMDIQMPEMDGFEAVAAIRRLEESRGNRQRTPVIALTAHAMKGDRDRCIAAGMDGYLAKPIRPSELDEVLAEYASRPKEIPKAVETAGQLM